MGGVVNLYVKIDNQILGRNTYTHYLLQFEDPDFHNF